MKDNRPLLTLAAITLAGFLVCSGFVAGCSFQGCEYKPEPPPVVVPEVVEGPRTVLMIRETDETEPNLAQAVTLLRNGDYAAYMAEKEHGMLILDDDLPEVGKYIPPAQHDETWVLILNDGQLLHAESVKLDGDAKAIAEQVMTALKAHGG